MLAQRHRRQPNINTALGQYIVFDGACVWPSSQQISLNKWPWHKQAESHGFPSGFGGVQIIYAQIEMPST